MAASVCDRKKHEPQLSEVRLQIAFNNQLKAIFIASKIALQLHTKYNTCGGSDPLLKMSRRSADDTK